jgi:hypothetical protein
MKRVFCVLISMVLFVGLSANLVLADAYVYGTSKRTGAAAKYLTNCGTKVHVIQTNDILGSYQGKSWPGIRVSSVPDPTGHEGIWVPVSDHAVSKGLCSDQKNLLDQYCVSTPKPLRSAERQPACKGERCWDKNNCGSYQTLRPIDGVRVVLQSNCDKWPQNVVCYKIEYQSSSLTDWPYGTGWGPTIVVRNLSGIENPYSLVDPKGVEYVKSVVSLKRGEPAPFGRTCYEVCILRNGEVMKDESPSQRPFGR